jgi:IMP dehydrogenase
MKEYSSKEQLCFDDILLVPQHSDIESRKQVKLNTTIGRGTNGIGINIPLIAAPMDTVCEWELAVKLRQLGGLGVIHRYNSIDQQVFQLRMIKGHEKHAMYAIGATGDYIERAWALINNGAAALLIDTANGHSKYAIEAVRNIRQIFGRHIHIMAGNVSTWEGFARLQDAGADSVRVGIGGGSVCTTRIVSGHGVPTLASILDIRSKQAYGSGASIIADGGIRNSGDAAKALAAGANSVMVGSMLAGTDESPGNITIDNTGKYKSFRGMASREAQYDGRGSVSVVEGVATRVPYKGSLESVVAEFTGGLGSALSYSGSENLKDFYSNSEYIRVSYLSLGESKPHAIK